MVSRSINWPSVSELPSTSRATNSSAASKLNRARDVGRGRCDRCAVEAKLPGGRRRGDLHSGKAVPVGIGEAEVGGRKHRAAVLQHRQGLVGGGRRVVDARHRTVLVKVAVSLPPLAVPVPSFKV